MTVVRAKAVGCGHYLPARVVSNNELAARIDTTDEWIRTRTGIERRHVAADGEKTSDLAIAAARNALATAGLKGSDIDAIVLATATPDQTFPSSATRVQHAIGMTGGFAFDLHAVCAGFIFALANANVYMDVATRVVVAWLWLRMAIVAQAKPPEAATDEERDFLQGKLAAARYWFAFELPRIGPDIALLSRLDATTLEAVWGGLKPVTFAGDYGSIVRLDRFPAD